MSDHEERDDGGPARQRRDFRDLPGLIDKLIGAARSEGHFDNLSGEGRPLDTTDDTFVPVEDRLGNRMLKSHGFAPPWMEARRDIDSEREKIERWLRDINKRWPKMHEASRAAARVEYRRMLADLSRQVMNYNLTAPTATGQIEGINIAVELARLGT
jgi:hypothetical protein